MKIVIATPLYPPDSGGPATYAKLLFEGFPSKDIEVELVKFSDVRHLPKIIRHYVYYRRVLAAARNADVVLALDPVSVGLPAMKAALRAEKPFVVKIVGDYAWEQGRQRFGVTEDLDEFVKMRWIPFPVRFLRRVQTRVARHAACVIVPSNYLKGIVGAWGIAPEKIQVIYNAVRLEEVGSVPEPVQSLPQPLIVSVGRLVPWKHIDGVIDSVVLLRKNGIRASLAIVDDGPDRSSLISHAEKNLDGDCIFTGTLSHADTLATMKSASVFVLNSSYEGLSHLLIEALSLGIPIVATRVGGNPEVITDEQDGLLVPSGDTPALAAALARVLSDERLRTNLSTHAVKSAERFSVGTMLAKTSDTMYAVRS